MSLQRQISNEETSIFEPRMKGIALPGLSTAQLKNQNNFIYIFGGGQSDVWRLNTSQINDEYSEQQYTTSNATSAPSNWMYTPPGIPWKTSNNTSSPFSQFLVVGTAQEQDTFLSLRVFDTISRSWSDIINTNTTTNNSSLQRPLACQHHSSFLLDDYQQQRLLVYGGENSTHAMAQFWSFEIKTQLWLPLALPPYAMRCGHSANFLDDGGPRMVVLGGFLCEKDQLLNNNGAPRVLADMSKVLIYDTSTSQWSEQSTVGPYPQPRAYHTTVKSTDNSLIVVGGQDGTPPPYQSYLSSNGQIQDMVAILNTTTWQWQTVAGTSTMEQPLPQSKATALMVDDHTLLYSFGTTYQTIYSGLYLFDTHSNTWMSSSVGKEKWIDANGNEVGVEPTAASATGFSETRHVIHIVLACVGSFCFVAVLILLYRMNFQWKQKLINGLRSFKKKIWKPRIGEPSWTETVRLILMLGYACFFLFLILCLVDQVVNSPIIDQLSYIENPSATVTAPDIRFCLDDEHTVLRCGTDLGMQCSEYLIPMSMHHGRHRNPYCYLFRAPPSFQLGQTSDRLASNGSYLKFDYYFGQPSQVEAAFYHPRHNPNLAIYSIPTTTTTTATLATPTLFTWNDPLEEMAFRSSEKKGTSLAPNIYQLDVNVVSTGSYELLQRVTLLDTFWNYVGFTPNVETFYEIDTKVLSETGRSDYSSIPRPLGSFHVFPQHYEIKTLHEQRAFALVNATGVFGGLFGLLVSFQALLFGYRPRSPLGVVHRWSVGDMKRSLLYGLQKSFVPQNTNVPIVHPMRDQTMMSKQRSMVEQGNSKSTSQQRTTSRPTWPTIHENAPLQLPPPPPPSTSTSTANYTEKTNEATTAAAAWSHTVSPSPSIPPAYPAATLTRTSHTRTQPTPFFQDANAFVAEPESYDDDTSDDMWVFGAERLTRMEDRMEVLEKVFQAYYINDEVFTALEMALLQTTTDAAAAHPRHPQPHQRRSVLSSLRQRTPFKRRQ